MTSRELLQGGSPENCPLGKWGRVVKMIFSISYGNEINLKLLSGWHYNTEE